MKIFSAEKDSTLLQVDLACLARQTSALSDYLTKDIGEYQECH